MGLVEEKTEPGIAGMAVRIVEAFSQNIKGSFGERDARGATFDEAVTGAKSLFPEDVYQHLKGIDGDHALREVNQMGREIGPTGRG